MEGNPPCSSSQLRHCSDSFNVNLLSNQWRILQSRFVSANDALEAKAKAVEERFKELEVREAEIEECFKVVEAERFKAVEVKEKVIEESFKAVETENKRIRERFKAVERKEKGIEERFKVVEVKETGIEERFKVVEVKEMEIVERFKVVELKEMEIVERFKAVEVKETEIEESFNAVEMEKKRIKERFKVVEAKETEIEERLEAVKAKERGIEELFREVVIREKGLGERFEAVEVEEKGIEERFKAVEANEMEIEERFKAVDAKETKIEERFKLVEAKEKIIEESFKAGEAEKKLIKERFEVVEVKEKAIEERFKVVEVKEMEIVERFKAVEAKETEIDEKFEVVVEEEKRVEERIKVVELKERGIEERFKVVEAKNEEIEEMLVVVKSEERVIEERFKAVELKERQLNERFHEIELELEKRRVSEQATTEVSERLREACTNNTWVVEQILKHEALELKEKELNELAHQLELKRIQIEDRLATLELYEREINRVEDEQARSNGIELKEKQVEEVLRKLDLKESELNDRCKAFNLKVKLLKEHCFAEQMKERENTRRISERLREVELREREVKERCQELELKEKKVDELNKGVELKQKEVNDLHTGMVNRISMARMKLESKNREQELKDKKLNEDFDSLKEKEKAVCVAFEELEVKRKAVSEKGVLLDVEEKRLSESKKMLELREKQNHVLSEALKLRQKEIEIKGLAFEVKQKEFEKHCQEHESRQKEEITEVPMTEIGRLGSDLMIDDGETLQLLLNDTLHEHCFMGETILKMLKRCSEPASLVLSVLNGFFFPHLKKGNVAYPVTTVRSSCLLLLEQLMNVRPEVCKVVKVKAEEMSRLWRQKMLENGENRVVVLGFLLFVVAFQLIAQFERDELKRLWEIVDQHRLASRLRLELDLFEECEGFISLGNSVLSQPETEQHHSASAVTDNTNCCSDIKSACPKMNANCLRSYLNKHVMDHKLFPQKIVDVLKSVADPTALVFEVLHCFNLPQSSITDKTSCIFLLEQLMKLQKHQFYRNPLGKVEQILNPPLQISQDMRINALAFASRWKQRLTEEGSKPLDVYGFLQFLASYQLANLYDPDELLQLFKVLYDAQPVYWPEENPKLCRALGLTKKIPGLIRYLIKEDYRLQAAKYVCTFMEEPHFPLALLLKDHVKFIQQKVEKIRGKSKDKSTEKANSTFELLHLREVVQYINDYKLDQEYSPTVLETRIEQLEAVIANLKTIPAKTSEKSIELPVLKLKGNEAKLVSGEKSNLAGRSDNQLDSHGVAKRHASSPASELPNQDKRHKVEALDSLNLPNITFKIPCTKIPFASENPQPLLPRQPLQPCSLKQAGKANSSEPAIKSTSTPGIK